MRLFIVATLLSLLGLSRYARAAAAVAGYPYRADMRAYSQVHGGFANAVGNSLPHSSHGYVRYLDTQGVQHIIGYNVPNAVQQQSRRITTDEYLTQLIKGSLNKDEAERSKARDEHFRLWSMNQYDQYRQETERLKAAGQEPTADLLAKVKTFEDIIIASRRGEASADAAATAQMQQVRDEHLRLWNEQAARLRSGQMLEQQHEIGAPNEAAAPGAIHLRFQSAQADLKSPAVPTTAQAIIIGETAEQKHAREEHLRLYQEELQRLQQAHAEAAKATEAAKKVEESSSGDVQQAKAQYEAHAVAQQQAQHGQAMHVVENLSFIQETPEVQRAKAEHLRLWHEAKQRAEKEAENENKVHTNEGATHQQQSMGHYDTKNIAYTSDATSFATQQQQPQHQGGFNFVQHESSTKYTAEQNRLAALTDRSDTVTIYADAHNSGEKYQEKLYGQQQQQAFGKPLEHKLHTSSIAQLPTPVQDTPEVQRARSEHLRILEELQKQAEFNAEKLSAIGGNSPSDVAQIHPQHYTPTAVSQQQGATKTLTTSVGHQQHAAVNALHQSQAAVAAVQDTIEVQRAREEHLKLLKEAFSKANEQQSANAAQASAHTKEPTNYAAPVTDTLPEPLNNNESTEEARLRFEEEKQREAERLAEEARLKEEARLQAEELKRLQLEEQRRQEQDSLDQARLEQTAEKRKDDEHYAERPQVPAAGELPKQALPQTAQLLDQSTQALQQLSQSAQLQTDGSERAGVAPQMLRFGGNQVGAAIPTTAYFIGGAQQPIAQQQQTAAQLQNNAAQPGLYYLRDVTNGYLNVDKPYLLQYIPNQQQQQQQQLGSKDAYAPTDVVPLSSALAALNQIPAYEKRFEKPIMPAGNPFLPASPSLAQPAATAFASASAPITAGPVLFPARTSIAAPITSFAAIAPSAPLPAIASFATGSSDAMKISYGSDPGLAALEKATREHFRAHEIALEQLRLNQKQPTLKDCY